MLPIVVAIDFSNTSIHAAEYATCMANKLRSDIHLVWVDKVTAQESVYPDASNESRNEAKKRFEELTGLLKPKLDKGLNIEYKLRKGRIYREIDAFAKTINARLIITGAHGITGFEEFWIGSNAYKIVTFTSLPVITIRNDFPITHCIRQILVPLDGSAETIQKIPLTADLAKLFNAEIQLLTTHNNNLRSIQRIANKHTQTAADYLRRHEVPFTENSIVATDLTKAVIAHAVDIKADLISITTEQETPVNIHMGARAQQLINQCPVPVLSTTPQEKFTLE